MRQGVDRRPRHRRTGQARLPLQRVVAIVLPSGQLPDHHDHQRGANRGDDGADQTRVDRCVKKPGRPVTGPCRSFRSWRGLRRPTSRPTTSECNWEPVLPSKPRSDPAQAMVDRPSRCR